MKNFIVLIALILPLGLFAQKSYTVFPDNRDKTITNSHQIVSEPVSPVYATKYVKRASQKTLISTSGNILTVGDPHSTCLTANQDLSLLTFTHRGNPGVNANDVGDILVAYSKDLGNTWKILWVLKEENLRNHRFPNGVIYNPAGNSEADDAYTVYSGPGHNGATNAIWYYTYQGSAKLDSTNINNEYIANPIIANDSIQISETPDMFSCTDGTFHNMTYNGYYVVNPVTHDSFLRRFMYIYNGTFNTANNKVDWTTKTLYLDNLYKFKILAQPRPYYTYSYADITGSAWSLDGSIGYIYMFAKDTLHSIDEQLIVYKSTDKGDTWNQVADTDLSNDTLVTNYLVSMRGTTVKRPVILEADATVDNSGQLHLFCNACSAVTTYPDSSGYFWPYEQTNVVFPEPVFHISTTPSNTFKFEVIDTLLTFEDQTSDANNPIGYGWNHRIQASRTADGKNIFCVWTDTDPSQSTTQINQLPDILTWGKNVVKDSIFPTTNQTSSTSIAGDNYFVCVSDITLFQPPNNYIIPVTATAYGGTYTDPVEHDYVHNIGYINSISSINNPVDKGFSISSNYPNPFTSKTFVDLKLSKNSDVSMSVVDLLGQTVQQTHCGNLNAGKHQLEINTANLSSGVYLLIVYAGQYSKTVNIMVK